ncbi:MAG: DUF2309 domain-containing protein [Haloarculaceae archaeon]
MSTEQAIRESIDRAATAVGEVWPLHSFVTANPLSGFEDRPFQEAVRVATDRFGGRGYPAPDVFRRAWDDGRIDPDVLSRKLSDHGYDDDPETLLDRMAETDDRPAGPDSADRVDRVLTKWLAAFLDQGTATWPMPNREQGFYAAWRQVAPHDDEIPGVDSAAAVPDSPIEAIEAALDKQPEGRWEDVFEHHLIALPGWTGLIKRRSDGDGDWQDAHPITLTEYLAVRLTLADRMGESIHPGPTDSGVDADVDVDVDTDDDDTDPDDDRKPLAAAWLDAWETTYRQDLVENVAASARDRDDDESRPAAQLVFCIDTRSEIIRRHLEAAGPYETHGYAGFFGVPMRYDAHDTDVTVDACPPIVDPEHHVADRPTDDGHEHDRRERRSSLLDAGRDLVKSVKSTVATPFSYVESAGSGYGVAMTARTLAPTAVFDVREAVGDLIPSRHECYHPDLDGDADVEAALPVGMTLEEKVEYAETAFSLMGWEQFGRLVVFTGHASETTNNPFDSSLDCGACAGNPGGPNARVLAAICNDEGVRAELAERGYDVPDDTVFLAAEHNTTTDEVTLFDGDVPASHEADVERLREDLAVARTGAARERAASMGVDDDADPIEDVQRRSADWAETRPEWGLAGNAGFVIGPRELTADLDLDGRAFLHSYDWSTDDDGEALAAILTGPMVVTQWINAQYYFATVDNAVYGSGSKVTHNPVGNVGVYQGNGGDLMTGLPLQSLYATDDVPYHQPLRLSTVVHAPVDRVTEVLAAHDDVRELLDNGWLSLTVVDPQQDHAPLHYAGDLEWTALESDVADASADPVAAPADD